MKRFAFVLVGALLIAAACARTTSTPRAEADDAPSLVAPAISADSVRVTEVAPGVTHGFYWMREGPWAVHVLDIDRTRCWTLDVAKTGDGAAGRATTSSIAARRALSSKAHVAGAVNGDFFLFAPPGVPTGPHVDDGRVVTGPGSRPALIIDSAGSMQIDTLRATGWLEAPAFGTEISGWNRALGDALAVFDSAWGAATDSTTGAVEVVVSALPRGLVLAIDTLPTGATIPDGGAVLVLGPDAPTITRIQLSALRPGADSVSIAIAIAPRHPREAIGGFPILVVDSAEVPDLDSAGGARFGPVRHPRTAVGIAAGGRRVLLVVVDGRQAPWSDGMTLPELARLMLALGATDAINLDGGGSTTMVVNDAPAEDPDLRVVNRPPDREGERPVGNALVVSRGACRGAP